MNPVIVVMLVDLVELVGWRWAGSEEEAPVIWSLPRKAGRVGRRGGRSGRVGLVEESRGMLLEAIQ